ncbi:MAG: DsbA family oxidoreductase [Gemmatimonadaceae bacterium]|jgi:predicted DsbA family dithiol-disulfide isomerase|nr:DsbA family oxidoreductase [Gemmatimonadaceae bacterium]
MPVAIDVFSDIACPWCWIGERRLRAALDTLPRTPPALRWRPFQLQPTLPRPSIPWAEFAESKFGGLAAAQPMFDRLTRLGDEVGVPFRFDRMQVAPNTADAHRLILLAEEHGQSWAAAEALFRAHFTDGRDVADHATLRDVASAIALPPADVDALLAGHELADDVRDSQREAARLGITGVPFFVLDGRLGVSGAQPPTVFLNAIAQLAETPAA